MSASDDRGSLIFTNDGPSSPDAAEIRGKMGEVFKGIWGQDIYLASETPQGQFLDSETVIIFDKNNKLVYLSNMWNPETSDGRWQDGICKIYFISRKPAIPTQVEVLCTGLAGVVIPRGALVQDAVGYQYAALDDLLISAAGSATGIFACTTPGPIYCAAGAITGIVTNITGWDLAENILAGVTGAYEERRAALEWRRYDSVAKNAHGNLSSIWGALANLDNVISVQIAENTTNKMQTLRGVAVDGHSFFVSIVGGAPQDIAWTIYQRKDGGCGYDGNTRTTILVPTRNNIALQNKVIVYNRPQTVGAAVKINLGKTEDTPGDIDSLIKQAVQDNWNGLDDNMPRVEIGETLLASRFYCSINNLGTRLFDLLRVRVGRKQASGDAVAWSDAVGFTLDEYPTLADADIKIVYGIDPEDSSIDGQFFHYDENGRLVLNPYVVQPTDDSGVFSFNEDSGHIEANEQEE